MWQGILHSLLLPLVAQINLCGVIHFLPLTDSYSNLKELQYQSLEVEVTTIDIKKDRFSIFEMLPFIYLLNC